MPYLVPCAFDPLLRNRNNAFDIHDELLADLVHVFHHSLTHHVCCDRQHTLRSAAGFRTTKNAILPVPRTA